MFNDMNFTSLYLFLFLGWLISMDGSSTSSNPFESALSPSSDFLKFVIVLFKSSFYLVFFYNFFLFILIYLVKHHSHTLLNTQFFGSLNIFKVVDLSSSSSKPQHLGIQYMDHTYFPLYV